MKRSMLALGMSLSLAPVGATEPVAPSMELLLYLAEWTADEHGELTDPLDVPEEADMPAKPESSAESDWRASGEEIKR